MGSQLQWTQEHRLFFQPQLLPRQAPSTLKRWREDVELAMRSQALVGAAPCRLLASEDDETMEQDGPESKGQRTVAGLSVCSLLPPIDEIPVSYLATHGIDDRPVYDHKTGERQPPHLVNNHSSHTGIPLLVGAQSSVHPLAPDMSCWNQ